MSRLSSPRRILWFKPPAWNAQNVLRDLSDWALWGLILVGFVVGMYFYTQWAEEQQFGKTITLVFQDANELRPGVNVRLMGVDVGYVKSVSVKPEHVEVVVRLFKDALPIPRGARVTILFTGLVGAKSIEIMPPQINPAPFIAGPYPFEIENPIRLKDAFDRQNEIAYALVSGSENIAKSLGDSDELDYAIAQNIYNTIDWVHDTTGRMIKRTSIVQNGFASWQEDEKRSLGQIVNLATSVSGSANQMTSLLNQSEVQATMSTLPSILTNSASVIAKTHKTIERHRWWHPPVVKMHQKVTAFHAKSHRELHRGTWDEVDEQLEKFSRRDCTAASFQWNTWSARILKWDQSIQCVNQKLESWNSKF